MTAAADRPRPDRRLRPSRSIRKVARKCGRQIGIHLGLVPKAADRGYMICATLRSGSGYFCQLLPSTGALGKPPEYFDVAGRRLHLDPKYPRDPKRLIKMIRSDGATANVIYGVKVMEFQVRPNDERVDLFRAPPDLRLVQLDWRDLVAQAIYLARARQTQQFASDQPARRAATYDAALIRTCLHTLLEQQRNWTQVIEGLGAAPIELEYEEILRDPQPAVDQVAALMRLAPPAPTDPALILTTIQRDGSTEEWRRRFLAKAGEATLDPKARQPV